MNLNWAKTSQNISTRFDDWAETIGWKYKIKRTRMNTVHTNASVLVHGQPLVLKAKFQKEETFPGKGTIQVCLN